MVEGRITILRGGARGRVYPILGMASLPDIVELADVGGAVPAARLISYSAAAD